MTYIKNVYTRICVCELEGIEFKSIIIRAIRDTHRYLDSDAAFKVDI